jgi:stage V sporulation protein G
MPTRRKPDGSFQDVAHPIHAQARAALENAVLTAYQNALREESSGQSLRRAAPDGDVDFD